MIVLGCKDITFSLSGQHLHVTSLLAPQQHDQRTEDNSTQAIYSGFSGNGIQWVTVNALPGNNTE